MSATCHHVDFGMSAAMHSRKCGCAARFGCRTSSPCGKSDAEVRPKSSQARIGPVRPRPSKTFAGRPPMDYAKSHNL